MKKNFLIIGAIAAVFLLIVFTLKGNMAAIEEEVNDSKRTYEYIPVKVQQTSYKELTSSIHTNGRMLPSEELNVLAEVNGKIVKVLKEKGSKVKKHETLCVIDPEVYLAQYEAAKASYEKISKDLKRYEKLVKSEAISVNDLEKAKLNCTQAKSQMIIAKKNYENTSIKSPINGMVNDDKVEMGAYVGGGSNLYELVNTNKLKINTTVGESEIMSITPGVKALISTNVYPQHKFEATVNAVAEKADKYYRYNIELTLENSEEFPLKGGMYAEIEFPGIKRNSLVIDRNAISGSLKNAKVFVVENNKALPKEITIGYANDHIVEVISGLNPGEDVITSGIINLRAGTQVKVIK